jgi:hypothetical protein
MAKVTMSETDLKSKLDALQGTFYPFRVTRFRLFASVAKPLLGQNAPSSP